MSLIGPGVSVSLSRKVANSLAPGTLPRWAREIGAAYGIAAPVLAADFTASLFLRAGVQRGAAQAVDTAWPGGGNALGADGAYRNFTANEVPVLSGIGLDLWRQVVNSYDYSEDLSVAAAWGAYRVTASAGDTAPLEGHSYALFEATESNVNGACPAQQTVVAQPAGRYTHSVHVKEAESDSGVLCFWIHNAADFAGDKVNAYFDPSTGTLLASSDAGAFALLDTDIKPMTGGGYRVSALFETASEMDIQCRNFVTDGIGLAVTAGKRLQLWGGQFNEGACVAPFIVTGDGTNDTRAATDVTDPDFASLASAYGLVDGLTVGAGVTLDRLSDAAARCLWSAGTDADNCARLEITASNTAAFTLRVSGSDALVLESGAFSIPGDKDITVTAKDGAWALAATGVAGDAGAGSYGLPALSGFRYGSQFGGTDYLNGAMKNLVLGAAA